VSGGYNWATVLLVDKDTGLASRLGSLESEIEKYYRESRSSETENDGAGEEQQ
jgi:hypothetical protein